MALKTDYNSAKMLKDLNLEMELGFEPLVADMKADCKRFLSDTRGQLQDHNFPVGIFKGTYIDRTKQLRGSLAAYIFRNGKLIWSDGGENDAQSRKIISEQIQLTPSGFDIIGIASKEYASHVESKGYNVMTIQGDTFIIDLGAAFYNFASTGKIKIIR